MGRDDEVEWFKVEGIASHAPKTREGNPNTSGPSVSRGFKTMIGNPKSSSLKLPSPSRSSNPFLDSSSKSLSISRATCSSRFLGSSASSSSSSKDEKGARSQQSSTRSTPLSKAIESLRQLSVRTGTDPASLIFSFLLLHEITAFLPLIMLFWIFNALGVGVSLLKWINGISENQDDSTTLGQAQDQSEKTMIHKLIVDWINEGMKRAEKYGRRKGYFGFEKESKKDALEESKQEDNKNEELAIGLDSNKLAGGLADAVAAYVFVKVSRGIESSKHSTAN